MAITSPNNTVSKKRQALFDRGFKANCEKISASSRHDLGTEDSDPLVPSKLADKLGVQLWNLEDVPGLSDEALRHLSSPEGDEWSAVTVVCSDIEIIVVNPSHSKGRSASDITHELSHLILNHDSGDMFVSDDGFMLREFNDKQEAEADWLAGALLLPRKALEHIKRNHLTTEQVVEHYGVSEQLFEYRCRMTAINKQYRR